MAALLAPPREATSTMERPGPPRTPTVVTERPRPVPPPASPATPKKKPRRRRRGPLLLVLALLVAAAVGTGAWWFGYARYTTTPGVIGLTQADAEQRLESAGLDVTMDDPAYSSNVPKGRVISTDPAAGDRVLDGGEVTVVVSLGKEVYDLPKLTGITEDEAQDRIQNANMAFGSTTKSFSETVPEGIVIASDPKGGTTLRPGTIVDLVVSKGRRPIPVGSWAGKPARRRPAGARAARPRGRGLPAVLRPPSPRAWSSPRNPKDGTLFKGDTVELLVSLGPELVEVPNVVAYGVDDATATLQDAGFEVEVLNSAGYLGLGFVYSMEPERRHRAAQGLDGDHLPRLTVPAH